MIAMLGIAFVVGVFSSVMRDLKHKRRLETMVYNGTQCGIITAVATVLLYSALVYSFGAP